jgi:hypothetical protein
MRTLTRFVATALVLAALGAVAGYAYLRITGLRGQPEPGALETRVARAARGLAIPGDVRARTNPLASSSRRPRAGSRALREVLHDVPRQRRQRQEDGDRRRALSEATRPARRGHAET